MRFFKRPARCAKLQGQVSSLFVCMLLVIVVFVGLAVDFSAAYRAKSDQEQSLEIVKDAIFASGEEIKFGSDTADSLFDRTEEVLRANRYTGTITCWFYEVNKQYRTPSGALLADNHRVVGVRIVASATYKPLFLTIISKYDLPIADESSWSFDFYSQADHIWRPREGAQGKKAVWVFEKGVVKNGPSPTTISGVEDLPTDLKQTIDKTVESI